MGNRVMIFMGTKGVPYALETHIVHGPKHLVHRSCPRNSHRLSTLTASRAGTSAPMVASGGTVNGSTSHTSTSEPLSALRQLAMESGMLTADP
jgi:hypothetical protein